MKYLTSILLFASSVLFSHAQSSIDDVFEAFKLIDPLVESFTPCTVRDQLVTKDAVDSTWIIQNARVNCATAIAQFMVEGTADQPRCFDAKYNYIKILSLPEDIMDTHFAVHDTVPNTHTMTDRVGTQGFEFGLAQTQDIRDAVLPCDETGQHYLIPFLWFDPMPSDTTMGTGYAYVTDFIGSDGIRYYCASGPIDFEKD